MRILISSRSEAALPALEACIPRRSSYQIESVLMINGQKDPLSAIDYRPDVLVLHNSAFVARELQALSARPVQDRPALVVVGDQLSTEAMKLAIRAGARDIIGDQEPDQLAACLHRLETELAGNLTTSESQTIVVVNGKGGSGSTFIATSLAHLAAQVRGDRTVVVDLDFQYAPLSHYLDLKPKRGLLEALGHAHELDEVAVQAYTATHESGLDVMAPIPDEQRPVTFQMAERMTRLLAVLKQRYDRIIVDLPRHLDDTAAAVLQEADDVVLVLQQSLLSVRDAVRLKTALTRDLGIPESRIGCVVNRYSKQGSLELADIRAALDEDDLALIPSQYKVVNECLDMGVPVFEQAPGSSVGKALLGLQGRLMGVSPQRSQSGFIAKTIFRLRG
jgi:pilus assembly protein CpaE